MDDNNAVLTSLGQVLTSHGFRVTMAATVADALRHISTTRFDVLLSDLHMPQAGDGLTVVSAMRHSNPAAVTMLLSAFPQMEAATEAILLQADEILVKPMSVGALVEAITSRLEKGPRVTPAMESVAAILDRTSATIISNWLARVHREDKLLTVRLSDSMRSEHLPQVFRDLVLRLKSAKSLGTKELVSSAAVLHGRIRNNQGYTAAMMVEESRILQVSIFAALQDNLHTIDFSVLLIDVMTIADEVDSQLSQAMESFIHESLHDSVPNLVMLSP